jgi:hypothetical protein
VGATGIEDGEEEDLGSKRVEVAEDWQLFPKEKFSRN